MLITETLRILDNNDNNNIILDKKLDFNKHLDKKIVCYKIIGMMKKLSLSFSRQNLLTIYKSFFRPIAAYADIIYDKPHKGSPLNKK